jgi:hypothetical protein
MGLDSEDEETALWRRTMEALLERGATPQEAIDGANLILQAYRRHRDEAQRGQRPERKEPEEE